MEQINENYVAVVDEAIPQSIEDAPEVDTTKEDLEQLQAEFTQQMGFFATDDSPTLTHGKFNPREDKVLVKIFNFAPSIKGYIGQAVFLVKSKTDNEWRPRTLAASEKVYPIVKVIKKGPKVPEDVEIGKLYTVPYDDIEGSSLNDEFLHIMQNFAKQGKNGAITNVPEDVPQRIPNIEKHWSRYKFRMPDKVGPLTEDEMLFFLIPALKLETKYEPLV